MDYDVDKGGIKTREERRRHRWEEQRRKQKTAGRKENEETSAVYSPLPPPSLFDSASPTQSTTANDQPPPTGHCLVSPPRLHLRPSHTASPSPSPADPHHAVNSPRKSIHTVLGSFGVYGFGGSSQKRRKYDVQEEDDTMEMVQIGAKRTKNVLILMSDAFKLEFGDEYRALKEALALIRVCSRLEALLLKKNS
nr:monogalactosyldiacylglycerol synthase 2, chloroplastic-like [Ipomoea batatas]